MSNGVKNGRSSSVFWQKRWMDYDESVLKPFDEPVRQHVAIGAYYSKIHLIKSV